MDFNSLKKQGLALYDQVDRLLFGAPTIVVKTFANFSEHRASEAAASIAYYALLSIFPLLIFLISFSSTILEDKTVLEFIFDFVEGSLPAAQDLLKGNIEQVLSTRGSVTIAGSIGLLWSASAVFNILGTNINRAWHTANRRNFLLQRLVALGMIAVLASLVLLWLLSTTIFNILPLLNIPIAGGVAVYNSRGWNLLSDLFPFFIIFFAFLNLYRWVPATKVRWVEAVWGAGVAALGWELIEGAFSWYLTSGFASYQLVYGSLGALIALLLWIYLSSIVVLLGAHLSATIAMETRLNPMTVDDAS